MNIFDSEPCDDKINKFRITCGEVYILTNIIELSKRLHSIDKEFNVSFLEFNFEG